MENQEMNPSARTLEDYKPILGYDVIDSHDQNVGNVESVWEDHTGQPAFLGVRSGWLGMGRIHIVPVHSAVVNERNHLIRLPFEAEQVKQAPGHSSDYDFSEGEEREVYAHFGVQPPEGAPAPADWQPGPGGESSSGESVLHPQPGAEGTPPGFPPARDVEAGRTIPLREEVLHTGKHEVESRGVRLRKVVHTETVNQPVELKREELEIERVPANGESAPGEFKEETIFVPLRREVPDVSKDTRVREEIHLDKRTETDRVQVRESVRKEDVETEQEE